MPLPIRRTEREHPLERWDPFQELSDLRERIDRVFESFWRAPILAGEGLWAPLADIEETDDALVVKAELPGVQKNDLEIEFSDAELVISGELKEEREGELRRRMRRTGRFEYRASLPADVDADKAEATLEHGVLTIRIPKGETARRRRIEVKG
jgi:HSP20 family protein